MPNSQIFAFADSVAALMLAAGFLVAYLVDKKLAAFRWWAAFYALAGISIYTMILRPVPGLPWVEAVSWVCLFAAAATASFGMYHAGEHQARPHLAIILGAALMTAVVVGLTLNGATHSEWVLWGCVPTVVFGLWSTIQILREKPRASATWIYAAAVLAGTVLVGARSVWFASATVFTPRLQPQLAPPPLRPGLQSGLPIPPPATPAIDQPLILSLATIIVMVGLAVAIVLRVALRAVGTLRERSTTDAMTGLLNRAAFDERAAELLETNKSQPVAALVIDIDYFKKINDTRGHAMGDSVIASLGSIISDAVADRQIAGRIGGEEFAILMPDANLAAARLLAEALRTRLASCRFGSEDPFSVTLSAGVAMRIENEKLHTLIARADKALYDAKNSGRNRVMLAATEDVMELHARTA